MKLAIYTIALSSINEVILCVTENVYYALPMLSLFFSADFLRPFLEKIKKMSLRINFRYIYQRYIYHHTWHILKLYTYYSVCLKTLEHSTLL